KLYYPQSQSSMLTTPIAYNHGNTHSVLKFQPSPMAAPPPGISSRPESVHSSTCSTPVPLSIYPSSAGQLTPNHKGRMASFATLTQRGEPTNSNNSIAQYWTGPSQFCANLFGDLSGKMDAEYLGMLSWFVLMAKTFLNLKSFFHRQCITKSQLT